LPQTFAGKFAAGDECSEPASAADSLRILGASREPLSTPVTPSGGKGLDREPPPEGRAAPERHGTADAQDLFEGTAAPVNNGSSTPHAQGASLDSAGRGSLGVAPFSRSLGDRSVFSGDLPHVALLRSLLNPTVILVTLVGAVGAFGIPMDGHYLMLAVLAFFVTPQFFERFDLFRLRPAELVPRAVRDVLFAWPLTAATLGLIIWATRQEELYDARVLTAWFVATPIALVCTHLAVHGMVRALSYTAEASKRVVVVGASPLGIRIAATVAVDPLMRVKMLGYFDDRSPERLPAAAAGLLRGRVADVPAFVRENRVNVVFVTLPMVAQTRVLSLLDELRDSTASVYFVPDVFTLGLIQSRYDEMDGIPLIAVSETPYSGVDAALKRIFDVVVTLAVLFFAWPLLLLVAAGVKLSSPGPVIFKQRRYGMDGREIAVYKFRSMRVTEDGGEIRQATRGDKRVTPFGAFIRKTSIDELPQLFNVLKGNMSLVGPRPHAVAHNEQYRKVIKGYMLRHKVLPGITGWAQVNGLRGETETLDQMRARVEHDIFYLRNWSLSLDLWILVRTVIVVLRDRNAY
jgi:putative colanic acid biosynthesis UDP-glucose lipid carrier transferase